MYMDCFHDHFLIPGREIWGLVFSLTLSFSILSSCTSFQAALNLNLISHLSLSKVFLQVSLSLPLWHLPSRTQVDATFGCFSPWPVNCQSLCFICCIISSWTVLQFDYYYFLQIVGFVLILSPVYSKITDLFTSWPIVGGTIACGVFIMLLASAGIYGAVKHHQIVLFFVSLIIII